MATDVPYAPLGIGAGVALKDPQIVWTVEMVDAELRTAVSTRQFHRIARAELVSHPVGSHTAVQEIAALRSIEGWTALITVLLDKRSELTGV